MRRQTPEETVALRTAMARRLPVGLVKGTQRFLEMVQVSVHAARYCHKLLLTPEVGQSVVVLGMHRSGTSAVAGILQMLGVNMGAHQLGPDDFNPKGHFENNIIKILNERLLRRAGGSWSNPPTTQAIIKAGQTLQRTIEHTIRREQSQMWGMKDPRLVLTFGVYYPYLVNPRLIVCRRPPAEVARSLKRRNEIPLDEGKRLAETYSQRLNALLHDYRLPHTELEFDDLFTAPDSAISKIVSFLGCTLTEDRKREMLSFIDPDLVTSSQASTNACTRSSHRNGTPNH